MNHSTTSQQQAAPLPPEPTEAGGTLDHIEVPLQPRIRADSASILDIQPGSPLRGSIPSQQFYFNYQANLPQKITVSSGASETKTVDILVVGGGPAALGLLVNAVKTNRLNELLQGDGIAIVDAGINFGGGILGKYGINSNTSGGGFLKCTFKKVKRADKEKVDPLAEALKEGTKKKKGAKLQPPTLPVTSGKRGAPAQLEGGLTNPYAQQIASSSKLGEPPSQEILAPYRELHHSNIGRVLKEFGKNTAPLAVIGHFLNYAGNHLLSFIHQTTKKKIFYPLHKVVSVQLMSNGEIMTKVKRQQLEISVSEDSEQLRILETDQVVIFRSKVLIMSNGGVQGLHPEIFNWFPALSPEKVITSDDLLRSQGFQNSIKYLNERKQKKVVILGGSHSGFSCAWMLLNGPAAYYNNNAGIYVDKEPFASRKAAKACPDCCQCGTVLHNIKRAKLLKEQGPLNSRDGPQSSKNPNEMVSPSKGREPSIVQCNCLCICFGLFDYDDWKFDYNTLPAFEDASIEILYRDQIKVFYNKVSDAEKDGYNQFEQDKFSKKDGYLYSFSGLRGDAKDLYLRIMRGQEKRVKLIQARDADEQRPYVDRADLVVWACGYQTCAIPIKDTDRKRLQLSQKVPNTQYDVDGKCRIMLADGHVLSKCFACGIGYPVRTKDGMLVTNPTMSNPRADGFSLYMNFVGDNILKSIIPKQKMIRSTVHKTLPKKNQVQQDNSTSETNGTFSKSKYQQVLRSRIMQYRQKAHDINAPEAVSLPPAELHEQKRNKSHNGGFRGAAFSKTEDTSENEQDYQFKKERVMLDETLEEDDDRYSEEADGMEELPLQIVMPMKMLPHQSSGGAKSLDRGTHKSGLSNITQMARSPQILQRKQEQMMKLQNIPKEEILNQDLAGLMESNDQIIAISAQPAYKVSKNKHLIRADDVRQHVAKSPYNNLKSQYGKQGDPKGISSSAKVQRSQGVGREILRSSQGGNRKLDQILAMQQKAPNNDAEIGGIFKMSKSSAFNQGKQRNARPSVVQQVQHQPEAGQMYNSIGSQMNVGQAYFNQSTCDQLSKSSRHGGREPNRIELPPILHPLSQNHYVYSSTDQHIYLQDSNAGLQTIEQDYALDTSTLLKSKLGPGQSLKSQKSLSSQVQETKSLRSSSIYNLQPSGPPLSSHQVSRKSTQSKIQSYQQKQHSRTGHSRTEEEGGIVQRERPLSDNAREDGEGQRSARRKLRKAKQERTDLQKHDGLAQGVTEEYGIVQRIESGAHFGKASPQPYENEGFENEADEADVDEHQDPNESGEDYGVEDPLREDVSSEGSCRTSIYQRSQLGDGEEDPNRSGAKVEISENASSKITKSTALQELKADQSSKSGASTKFSFQSKIPRLNKQLGAKMLDARQEEHSAIASIRQDLKASHNQRVKGPSQSPAPGEKMFKRASIAGMKDHSETRQRANQPHVFGGRGKKDEAVQQVILSNQQQQLEKRETEVKTSHSNSSHLQRRQNHHQTSAVSKSTAQQASLSVGQNHNLSHGNGVQLMSSLNQRPGLSTKNNGKEPRRPLVSEVGGASKNLRDSTKY